MAGLGYDGIIGLPTPNKDRSVSQRAQFLG